MRHLLSVHARPLARHPAGLAAAAIVAATPRAVALTPRGDVWCAGDDALRASAVAGWAVY
ncbi:hypothetical protein [Sorangium sp. So ce1153]|uniref:hypothetical protein n=1 Tax=Sorangium sp. So ce1153 TaxID=3133333 RepID=UPI003F5EA62E